MDLVKSSSVQKNKFNIKSHKVLRLNTVQRDVDLPDINSLSKTKHFSRVRINSMKGISSTNLRQKIRKYTEIEEQLTLPFSPLKVSPSKQYESKLKLSAQSWVIYDMKNSQYKRGWMPDKASYFNGLLRIVVLFSYCEIVKLNPHFKSLKVKINPQNLKISKFKMSKNEQKRLRWIAQSKRLIKTLTEGTIISLADVIKGMITSGNQDLFQYSLIYCGFLIYHLQNKLELQNSDHFLSIKQEGKQNVYSQIFCQYCNDTVFNQIIGLKDTKVQNGEESYELISTPNQICKIFLKGFHNHGFFKGTAILQKINVPIKFPVGFNYWEDRIITIKSKKKALQDSYVCSLVYKGLTNYEAISYNKDLQILMIIEDSKFSMADLDFGVLQKWYSGILKLVIARKKSSISPQRKKKTIFPVISLSKG